MNLAGASDRGYLRANNQDSYMIQRTSDAVLAVVCDGIGGARAGDVASSVSCRMMEDQFLKKEKFTDINDGKQWLKNAIIEVNQHIVSLSRNVEDYQGMGTTMVAALFTSFGVICANVGDSRIYGINDRLILLSDDHTLVNELVKLGKISIEDAHRHPNRNMLTNAIGIGIQIDIDVFATDDSYDYLLLCSDGLHGYIDMADAFTEILSDKKVESKVKELILLANQAGGYDNTTVILCDLRGAGHE